MKIALAIPFLALGALAASMPRTPLGQVGNLTATLPKKDGIEHVTLGFKLPDQAANMSLTAEVAGIHGLPRDDDDDPQTTAEDKAQAIADALQDAIDAMDEERMNQVPPLPATGLTVSLFLNQVSVGLPGGNITTIKKTNNTNEPRDTASVTAPEGLEAVGEVALAGAISGAPVETGGAAQLWIQVGWDEFTVPTEQGMTMSELVDAARRTLELEGFRVMTTGQSGFAVVLPAEASIFGVGSDDRTLEIESFSAAVL